MSFDAPSATPCTTNARSNCSFCPASQTCLAATLPEADRGRWEALHHARISLTGSGKALYTSGDRADAVFIVRAGCIKTCSIDADGNERVRGFFFPGDVVGLEALGSDHYPASALAVGSAQVCAVPRAQLQPMMAASPAFAMRVMERISADLRLSLALGGDYSADQRLAAFILSMQQRLAGNGGRVESLRLPMTRRDIGNYLRLATETVCRVMTRFESSGWLASRNKTLTLRMPASLMELAAPVGVAPTKPGSRIAA